MKRNENECVDCGLPCLGSACPLKHVSHYYCDHCNTELKPEELYMAGDEEWCIDCILDNLEKAYP